MSSRGAISVYQSLLLASAILCCLTINAQAQDVKTIDFPGAVESLAQGVNNGGEIVGYSCCTAGNRFLGFSLTGNAFQAIDCSTGFFGSIAFGINKLGQVVGACLTSDGNSHGFIITNGVMSVVDFPGSTQTVIQGINDSGQMVGWYSCAVSDFGDQSCEPGQHGFVLIGGVFNTIDFPGVRVTVANGINNLGQIVGTYRGADNIDHGFMLSNTGFISIDVPGSNGTEASGINDSGQVVGSYAVPPVITIPGSNAFLLTAGQYQTINVQDASVTQAFGINNSGNVVGVYVDSIIFHVHGFSRVASDESCAVSLRTPPLPYHQFDTPWNTDIYAHHSPTEDASLSCPISRRPTIQCLGCALTALSTVLYQSGITQFPIPFAAPQNPGTLNTFMLFQSEDFDGDNNVDFFTTTLDVGFFATNKTFFFNDLAFPNSSSSADLFQAVCKNPAGPTPVIVKVAGSSEDHYVVVTGGQRQADGTFKFAIVDPGHSDRTSLDDYQNRFAIRGFVQDPPGDGSALSVATGGAGEILVVDDSGKRTGFDATTGTVVNEITASAYYRDTLGSDEGIDIPAETLHSLHVLHPSQGNYTISVSGLQLSTYEVIVRAFSQDRTPQPALVLNGLTAPGTNSTFQILFASSEGTVSTAARIASFSSTLSDIANSINLRLLKKEKGDSFTEKVERARDEVTAGEGGKAASRVGELRKEVGQLKPQNIGSQVLLEDLSSLLSQLPPAKDDDDKP
jgi:probable HAF family extracellular repeat protein